MSESCGIHFSQLERTIILIAAHPQECPLPKVRIPRLLWRATYGAGADVRLPFVRQRTAPPNRDLAELPDGRLTPIAADRAIIWFDFA